MDSQISKACIGRTGCIRTRDILRKIALEHEIEINTGKVSVDHVHMFIAYRPTQNISKIMQ